MWKYWIKSQGSSSAQGRCSMDRSTANTSSRAPAAWASPEGSPGQVSSVPAPLSMAGLPLLPRTPLSDNLAAVTLVTFCQLGAGLRPAHRKIASKQIYIKPNAEEQLLVKGETSSLHSQAPPGKASWTKAELQLLNWKVSSVWWFVWLCIMTASLVTGFMWVSKHIHKYLSEKREREKESSPVVKGNHIQISAQGTFFREGL